MNCSHYHLVLARERNKISIYFTCCLPAQRDLTNTVFYQMLYKYVVNFFSSHWPIIYWPFLKNKGGWKYVKLEYFHSSLKPTRQTSLCEGSARFSVVYQLMINIFISNLSLWKAVYVMRTLFIPIILGRVLLTDVVKK